MTVNIHLYLNIKLEWDLDRGCFFLDNTTVTVINCYCCFFLIILTAAALGNLISDLAGVGSAGYVELLASKVGVHPPDLTPAQTLSRKVRWSVGIVSITTVCYK